MNVLFLMADEMSTWGLGAYPEGRTYTPCLDSLATRGMRFDAAYTPSPICVPTRAAIACGRWLHEIEYWSSAEAYDGKHPSWGHALQSPGIPVVSIGKLHYRNETDSTGFDRQIKPMHIMNGLGWITALLRRPVASYTEADNLAHEIGPGDSDYLRFDRRVTAAARQWLTKPARTNKPWCAFVSWLSPHFPFIAPPEFYELYDPAGYSGPPEPQPNHPVLREIAKFFSHDRHFTDGTRGRARANYLGLCSFLDDQVRQVLDALETSGLADDTLVIFTSDHGEMLGAKGFWTKSTMYDDACRVPLIVAGPNIAPEIRADPVSLVDIAPTICEHFGAQPLARFSGRSLLTPPDPTRAILSEYHDGGSPVGMTMLRWNENNEAWKYVHYAEGYPPQLFYLSEDPNETRDLSTSAPRQIAAAQARLAAMLDPEEVNRRAHAHQARRIEELGGRARVLAHPTFNYTPVETDQAETG